MATLRNRYLQMIEEGPSSLLSWFVFLGLWPLSCLYGVVVWLRLLAYSSGLKKTYVASVPVISVGNLSVGGTGKTPMTDFLVKWMTQRNVPVAVVSRGYGGNYTSAFIRVNGEDEVMHPAECGDEPYLLAKKNPDVAVFVARERSLGVKAAEEAGAKLIILDDGFQHRAVHRDLDIVLLDNQNPFGNGHLLPAGELREPQSALQRSHLLVMTRTQPGKNNVVYTEKPVLYSQHVMAQELRSLSGDTVDWDALVGKSCVAFAGIARPTEFFDALKDHNLSLLDEIPLADHQVYDSELLGLLSSIGQNCDALITTEKDAVKLTGVDFPVNCYQVGVELSFEDDSLLDAMLHELIVVDSPQTQAKKQ